MKFMDGIINMMYGFFTKNKFSVISFHLIIWNFNCQELLDVFYAESWISYKFLKKYQQKLKIQPKKYA